jgi:hypothetical protein
MRGIMDLRTEQAIEAARQDELLRNERVVEHPVLGEVRLKRPTPGQERVISEERRKQYQRDLMDDSVLARDQIEKKAEQRGMWTPELTARIGELTRKTGEAMGLLDLIGFQSPEDLLAGYETNVAALLALYPDDDANQEIRATVSAYYSLDGNATTDQRKNILASAPTTDVDDLLDAGDLLRTQIEMLQDMTKVRIELGELYARQSRIFIDSIESRSDRAEEMARVYACATHAATGKPLWSTFAEIWDADGPTIEWIVLELHYFLNGVTEEFKATLGKYGFIKRLSDKSDSSDDSPVQPPLNSAGESPESQPESSSEVTALTVP